MDTEPRHTERLKLTENAVAVLRKRYLKKNERGEAAEEPIDMFRRVAGAVAEAEVDFGMARGLSGGEARAVFEEQERRFLDLMLSRKFMPNSPTLMNAGRDLGQLSACFAAGTMIDTIDGPCPIEDIEEGALVLTHMGRYRPVVRTMRRVDRLYRVKVDKLPALYVTGEHPFLTSAGWVETRKLRAKKHFVRLGFPMVEEEEAFMRFNGHVKDGLVHARLVGESGRSRRRHARDGNVVSRQIIA
ncbi:MAG: Ribonucleotide reductase of class II (coenzyme B12-dependent), partial [uncultured Rubrobacteraceae bacterium]